MLPYKIIPAERKFYNTKYPAETRPSFGGIDSLYVSIYV